MSRLQTNARRRIPVKPPYGQNTIRPTIAFFADQISKRKNRKLKAECWDTGFVYSITNEAHGIKSQVDKTAFNSSAEIPLAIERRLIQMGVRQHHGNRSKKYFAQN
jgi:hypothetical protein